MSRTYRAICALHQPAILVDPYGDGWTDEPAVAAAIATANKDEPLSHHQQCDLLIGAWSGGLVEIGCPPRPGGELTCPARHYDTEWISVSWLRLLIALPADSSPHLAKAIGRLPTCWRPARVSRLGSLLA